MGKLRTTWSGAFLAAMIATGAHAGSILGSLRTPAPSTGGTQVNPYAGSARSLPGVHMMQRGLATDAVVFVDEVPAGTDAGPAPPMPRLSQKDQMFAPRVVAVAKGNPVDFPNMDPIFHNVFSVSPARRFDLGKYPRGHTKQVTFSKAGLVKVYCDIHANMEAFVMVLPHGFFARPDAAGHFSLPPLPPGTYTLKVWHPDLPELTREVRVGEGDLNVTLEY